MKHVKRSLSWLLVFAMVLSLFPVVAPAAKAVETEKNSRVLVDVAEAKGSMNLSELGTTDWMHVMTTPNRMAKPTEGGEPYDLIEYMNPSDSWGRTVGRQTDEVWRYQTFVSSATGKLTSLQVAMVKRGSPSALVAKLYKMGEEPEEIASITIPADQVASNAATELDFGDITIEAGVPYALALTQETPHNQNQYGWCGTGVSFPSGKINENGEWIEEETYASIRVVVGTPTVGGNDYDIIDFMNASANSGRTFGQVTDQVWRFQTFASEATGKLTELQVALIKKGTPSTLIAKLYKMGETPEELASTTVPESEITSNTALNLDFGDVTIEAGELYAVAMSQEVLNNTTNQYWWCNATTSFRNGKIKEDGSWVYENTAASLRVVVGDPNAGGEKEPVGIINFETVGAAKVASDFSDSPVAYTWNGGIPTWRVNDITKGGVISYKNGQSEGDVTEEAGWKITIPASEHMQVLTFVSGVWQASTEVRIFANGDTENPIYTNTALTATNPSVVKKYTVTVEPNTSLEVYGKLTKKTQVYGNVSMGGITLSNIEVDESMDYIAMLREAAKTAQAWLNEDIDQYFFDQLSAALESAKALLEKADITQAEAYEEYVFLTAAISAVEHNLTSGAFANSYASGMTASFGWEGDIDAPIAWIDGTYRLRDNDNKLITFGVTNLPAKSIKWYNAEGYLPCFVSEYSKNGVDYKIENFADLVIINDRKIEVAYSRMTATNNNEITKLLPTVSEDLIPLNDAAKNVKAMAPGETVVRDYCIGADRFGDWHAYPANDVLAAQGSFNEHYEHMKNYWNTRLDGIINIESIPESYSELIDAYKAGYIYMLIISDGYELHVGENGYDRVFDHDVIGMLASLIESGHTEHFADYAQYILQNIQYPDAAWKFSWPFALYLQKTGDFDTVQAFWNDQGSTAGIKTNTHKIASERVVYDASILDVDGNPARIMKQTYAIDNLGYWVIDNFASLFGLTTYSYICQEFYEKTGEQEYKDEYDWAKAEYDSLIKSVEAVLGNTLEKYDLTALPISMVMPNWDPACGRTDPRDGNWAASYLFGRWNWDGYLFGAPQDSWILDLTDATYDFVTDAKSAYFDSVYNMGGYPHGIFSSAYNAGYFSAGLSSENWRDGGIEAYLWMINNSMGGLYGWWEGVAYPNENNVWDRNCSNGGGGSCQHMWGQSTATKVLIDSFFAEKADGSVIAGRGLPIEFNADGEEIKVSNYICNAGKRIGFTMNTEDKTITFALTGDELENAVSLELIALVNNIESVSDGLTFDEAAGSVLLPAGTKSVTITMKRSMAEVMEINEANHELKAAINAGEKNDVSLYVTSTGRALTEAIEAGKALLTTGTVEEKKAAAQAIYAAIDALVVMKTYDALDYVTGRNRVASPTFGRENDQRARYATFKADKTLENMTSISVMIEKFSDSYGDCLVSIYSLEDDHYTLKDCLATGRMAPQDIASGELNKFELDKSVTLEAGAYYAIHFAMDNSNGYGTYYYYAGDFLGDDLYACKIQGSGEVVNENQYGLGTPLMLLQSIRTDKTELDAAVESAPEKLAVLVEEAKAVLLDRDATQEEIDAMLAKLKTAMEEDHLFVVDGGKVVKMIRADELAELDITKLAAELGCLNQEGKAFAGWFTAPQVADDYADWAAKSVKNAQLTADNSMIYAWYIDVGFLDTTIAYTSNASRATKVFAISTAPADLFANYGFVLSTAPSASDENLVIGGKIDGLNVAKLEKTTIYSWISVAPFSAAAPKTANDFNGGLGGVYKDGTDGYISYGMVTNMPIGKTISARAYYTTLDGTIVYGSTVQQLLEANSNVTGLE